MKWAVVGLAAAVPLAFAAGWWAHAQQAEVIEVHLPPAKRAEPPPEVAVYAAPNAETEAGSLAQHAQEAYVKGEMAQAIDLCNLALARQAHQPLALRILGAAYCKAHDRTSALRAMKAADPQFRPFIRFVCHNEGLELPPA